MNQVHVEHLLRILLGTMLGGVIGFERDLHGRPAGLRTHTIVALASATFMVVSTRFMFAQHYGAGDLISVDPSRIAASVVSGIGFLGAGAILRTGITIRGLTTAAGLWLVAAIGMAAGGGMYVESVFATVVGLASLTLLRRLEDRGEPIARQRVAVLLDVARSPVVEITAALGRKGAVLTQEIFEGPLDDGTYRITFEVRTTTPIHGDDVARSLDGLEGVKHLRIERL